jgi:hypothetical protein
MVEPSGDMAGYRNQSGPSCCAKEFSEKAISSRQNVNFFMDNWFGTEIKGKKTNGG